jgi:hypothetical protein
MKIHPVGAESFHAGGRTSGYDELKSRSSQFWEKRLQRVKAHTDRCGNTCGQKCHSKASRKEAKIQEFMYGDT